MIRQFIQFIQAFSRIFRDIQEYSAKLTDAKLGRSGEGFPCPLSKFEKSGLILGKKGPDCAISGLNFPLKMLF